MTTDVRPLKLRLLRPQYASDIDLDALQGAWTTDLYLKLSEQTNQLIEFTAGKIEAIPMPTRRHQMMLLFLYELLKAALVRGIVLVAPMRLQVRADKFREPDLMALFDRADPRNQDAFWFGADLVVEVVSPDDPERDTVVKRGDYAEAGIPEYWIVNPLDATITVLALEGDHYRTHGIFARGDIATSPLVVGVRVEVEAVFSL